MTRLEKLKQKLEVPALIVAFLYNLTGLVTLLLSFLRTDPMLRSIRVPALVSVVISLAWIFCLDTFAGWSRSLRKIKEPLSPRLRRFARAGMIGIPVIALVALVGWMLYQWQSPEAIIVLVTDIHSRGPEPYGVTDEIVDKLELELNQINAKRNKEVARVDYLERSVFAWEGERVARALGRGSLGHRDDATMVIWGWYIFAAPSGKARLHLELLTEPQGEPGPYSIANVETLDLQSELSEKKMIWLIASVGGMAYYFLEDYEPAIERFTIALTDLEYSSDALGCDVLRYYRANAYYYLGAQFLDEANTDLDEATTINPKFSEAYNLWGIVHWELAAHEQAIADFTQAINKAIEIDHNLAKAYRNRGVARYNVAQQQWAIGQQQQAIGQYQQAIADFTRATEIAPDFAEAYAGQGVVYRRLGEHDEEAIAAFDKAIEANPNYAKAYYQQGVTYLKRGDEGDYEQAIAAFDKATEIHPKYAKAYYRLGLTYRILGDYEQAIANFNKAIHIDSNYDKAYYERGLTHIDLGQYEQAIADFTEAIRIDPNLVEAYYHRGVAAYDLRNFEGAIHDFESYLLLAPLDAEPWRTWAQQYIEQIQQPY